MSTEPILESIADLWSADCLMFRTKLTQDPLPRSRRRCYRSLQVVVSPWCRHLPLCSLCLASYPAPPGGDAHTPHALLPAGPAADFVALNPQVTSLFASFSLALHELLLRGLLWLGGCGGGTLWRMHFATLLQSLLRGPVQVAVAETSLFLLWGVQEDHSKLLSNSIWQLETKFFPPWEISDSKSVVFVVGCLVVWVFFSCLNEPLHPLPGSFEAVLCLG